MLAGLAALRSIYLLAAPRTCFPRNAFLPYGRAARLLASGPCHTLDWWSRCTFTCRWAAPRSPPAGRAARLLASGSCCALRLLALSAVGPRDPPLPHFCAHPPRYSLGSGPCWPSPLSLCLVTAPVIALPILFMPVALMSLRHVALAHSPVVNVVLLFAVLAALRLVARLAMLRCYAGTTLAPGIPHPSASPTPSWGGMGVVVSRAPDFAAAPSVWTLSRVRPCPPLPMVC